MPHKLKAVEVVVAVEDTVEAEEVAEEVAEVAEEVVVDMAEDTININYLPKMIPIIL
jgi:hypothetical protein